MTISVRSKRILLGMLAIALTLSTASSAAAQLVTVPPGLNPGDQYRLAFVTDGGYIGSHYSISSYDSYVQGEAGLSPALAALGTTWKVIGSTANDDALVHTDTTTHPPIYRLDGVRIADSDQLWGFDLDAPLNIDRSGNTRNVQVWTGTWNDGLASLPLGDPLNSFARTGNSGNPDSGWIASTIDTMVIPHSLYAISDILTVPGAAACAADTTLTTQAEVDAYPCVTPSGNLTIGPSSNITNLNALSDITSVGGTLHIHDNAALLNLDGLAGISSIGGNLQVSTNPTLPHFCGLFPLLGAGGLSGSYTVASNLENPSQGDILAGGACGAPTLLGPYAVFSSSQASTSGAGEDDRMIDRSGLTGTGALELQPHQGSIIVDTVWSAGAVEGGLGAGATGAPPAVANQEVVFDLGIPRTLEGVYVWNYTHPLLTERGVDQLEILTSGDSDPLTATYSSVGVFNLAEAGGPAGEPAQLLSFSAVDARLVKFDIQTAHSGAPNDYVGLAEVLFATRCTTHRWRFDDPAGVAPDGTPAPDATCGKDGVVHGANASHTGTGLQLPGGIAGSGAAYVDLPNGLVSGLDSVTLEAWYTLDGAEPWARLFDFGNSGGSEVPPGPSGNGEAYLFHAVSQGTNNNAQRTEILDAFLGSDGVTINTAAPATIGETYHIAVTVEKNGGGPGTQRVSVYRDGVLLGQDTTTRQLADIDDVNAWLGRSNYDVNGFLEGTILEFRLYEEALSGLQVMNSWHVGPDVDTVALPEPGTAIGLGSGFGMLVALARRRRSKAID